MKFIKNNFALPYTAQCKGLNEFPSIFWKTSCSRSSSTQLSWPKANVRVVIEKKEKGLTMAYNEKYVSKLDKVALNLKVSKKDWLYSTGLHLGANTLLESWISNSHVILL